MKSKIEWFWAHRRNASLNHFSFLMHGLSGRGWLPVVNFFFNNQIVIGVPGKGCYVFYDRNELNSRVKYRDVQRSIDKNSDFVKDFRRKTDEIFGAIFFRCLVIDEENLPLLTLADLSRLYRDLIDAIMVGPIITVQLWGIEACFDENYIIMKFLNDRLRELNQIKDLLKYKEILSANTGETVAYTEQKNFFQVVAKIFKNEKLRLIFEKNTPKQIINKLNLFEFETNIIKQHMKKYEWVNTEYIGEKWSEEKWIDLFKKAITDIMSPEKKLDLILKNFEKLNIDRNHAIEELNPPRQVRHAIDCLAELIAQRDWTKGYFAKALLSYGRLLNEVACRMNRDPKDLLYYSYKEIMNFFEYKKIISSKEIENRRRNGYVIVIKNSKFNLITGKSNINNLINKEGVNEPFEKIIDIKEFKGLPASRGVKRGMARVMEDALDISKFKEGEILVTYMTTIEFTPVFRKASAVVTDEGGMSCHAAIISREFSLPCVVGTKIATRVIATGDEIEVDANRGIIKIIK